MLLGGAQAFDNRTWASLTPSWAAQRQKGAPGDGGCVCGTLMGQNGMKTGLDLLSKKNRAGPGPSARLAAPRGISNRSPFTSPDSINSLNLPRSPQVCEARVWDTMACI